jgi:hypothetical protein
MQLQTVSAGHGATWVRQGFRVFFKRPMAFTALFAAFMFAVVVLALLPVIGPLLVLVLLPLVTLAFMIATQQVMAGQLVTPRVYALPFQGSRRETVAILQLGLMYAVSTYAVLWLSDRIDGGAFDALMDAMPAAQTAPEVVAAKLADPRLLFGMLVRFGLAGLLSVPFWHAPALVHWGTQGAAQSLFSSTLACWRNRGAFTVYSLMWFALVAGLGTVGSLVFGLLGAAKAFAAAAVPMSLFITTVFYASLYFTFADSFTAPGAVPVPPTPPASM